MKNNNINILIQENIIQTISEIEKFYMIIKEEEKKESGKNDPEQDDEKGAFSNFVDQLMEDLKDSFAPLGAKASFNKKRVATLLGLFTAGADLVSLVLPGTTGDAVSKAVNLVYVFIGLLYISASYDYGGDQKHQLFLTGLLLLCIGTFTTGIALAIPGVGKALALLRNKNVLADSVKSYILIGKSGTIIDNVSEIVKNTASSSTNRIIMKEAAGSQGEIKVFVKVGNVECPVTNTAGDPTIDLSASGVDLDKVYMEGNFVPVDLTQVPVTRIESIDGKPFDYNAEINLAGDELIENITEEVNAFGARAEEVATAVNDAAGQNPGPAAVILTNSNVSKTLPAIIDSQVQKQGEQYVLKQGTYREIVQSAEGRKIFGDTPEENIAEGLALVGEKNLVELDGERLKTRIDSAANEALENSSNNANLSRTQSNTEIIDNLPIVKSVREVQGVSENIGKGKAKPEALNVQKKEAILKQRSVANAQLIRTQLRETLATKDYRLRIPIYKEIDVSIPGRQKQTLQVDTGWEIEVYDCSWRGQMGGRVRKKDRIPRDLVDDAEKAYNEAAKQVKNGKLSYTAGAGQVNISFDPNKVTIVKKVIGGVENIEVKISTTGLSDAKAGDLETVQTYLQTRADALNEAKKWDALETSGFIVKFEGDGFTPETTRWIETHLYGSDDAVVNTALGELAKDVGVTQRPTNTAQQNKNLKDAAEDINPQDKYIYDPQATVSARAKDASLYAAKKSKDAISSNRGKITLTYLSLSMYTRYIVGADSQGNLSPAGGITDTPITLTTQTQGDTPVVLEYQSLKQAEDQYGSGSASEPSFNNLNLPDDDF